MKNAESIRVMSATTEQVFIQALSLPTRQRAASPEIEAAWKGEAIDRCKAFDEGKITEREVTEGNGSR